jgi:hypothetical protein
MNQGQGKNYPEAEVEETTFGAYKVLGIIPVFKGQKTKLDQMSFCSCLTKLKKGPEGSTLVMEMCPRTKCNNIYRKRNSLNT